jgi:signal transduction histidine kinase
LVVSSSRSEAVAVQVPIANVVGKPVARATALHWLVALSGAAALLATLGLAAVFLWQRDDGRAVAALLGAAVAAATLLWLIALLLRQLARQERLTAELRASEAAVQRYNKQLVDGIRSLSVSFSLFDADDRLIITNRAHSAMTDVMPGTPFVTLLEHAAARLIDHGSLAGDPAAWVRQRLERHLNPQGPFDQRYRDGTWLRIEEARTGEGGTVVTRTDITELKRVEEVLRSNEERFRDYVETASEWHWDTDADHRFTYFSGRSAGFSPRKKLGDDWNPGFALGRRRSDIALDYVAADPRWQAHLACLDRHEPFFNFVYHARADTGDERYFCVSGKPVFDAGGKFIGYRGTGRDVTDQIAADVRLREAKAAAEAANRAKSEFLAGMSHELRTPLNAIIGFSELIAHQHCGGDLKRMRDYAGDIHASGHHLLKVINEVLEVSRIEAGRLELHEEAVDLHATVEVCLKLVMLRAEEGGIGLDIALPPDLPALYADATRLKQILLNLLSNAVKFTPRGGRVSVAGHLAENGGLVLSVCDDGIGMSEDDIVVALQPFRQVDSSLARRFEGTGLGLPLAKAFVELHGGRLEMTSAPSKGTTVEVIFPPERVIPVPTALPAAS